MERCALSVKGAICLSKLLKNCNSLQELYMGDNDIGDDGISLIAEELQDNRTLRKLDVVRCGLSSKGAISISQALMVNQTLLELYMWGNGIGDDGIIAIAGSLSKNSIAVLNASNCGISFTGARSLAAALQTNQNVRAILLRNNPITVDGARLIIQSIVDNKVCLYACVNDEYKDDDEVKKMLTLLDDRKRQEASNKGSSKDESCFERNSLEELATRARQTTRMDTQNSY